MERKSSIHVEKGNLGYCFHNTRQKPTANSIFDKAKNEVDNDAKTAIEIYRTELKKRVAKYTQRTGRKLNKNTITHLSAIVNLDERHTLEDVKKVGKYLEDTLGTKVFQIAVHRDEGHIDGETGKPIVNYHAHLELLGLDKNGNSVRRKLTKSYLINLQSKVAEILGMQRGINYTKERKKRPKRLDTYEYKEHAKRKAKEIKPVIKENEELKLSKKELEKQISELRKKMIEANKKLAENQKIFTQEDYKYLSELKRLTKSNNLKEIYFKFLKFQEIANNKIKEAREKAKEEEEEKEKLKKEKEKLQKELDFFKQKFQYTESYTKVPKKQNYFNLGYFYYLREMQLDATAYFQYGYKDAKEVKINEIDKVIKVKIETENSTLIDTGDAIQLKAILNKKNKFEEYKKQVKLMINLMLKKSYKLNELEAEGEELFIKAFEEIRNTYFQMNFKKNSKTIGIKF